MPVSGSTADSLGWRRLIETLVRLPAGVGLILANGFFVTTEFALTRLRRFSREELEARQELAFVMEGDRVAVILTSTDALEAIAGELGGAFD